MKKKILIASLLSTFSLGASAQLPTFDFVEVGSSVQDHDMSGEDFGGFELEGSYQFTDDFYIAGKHVSTNESDLELATTTLGIGYQLGVTEHSVFYTQLDIASVLFERDAAGKFEDQGFQIGIGYRHKVSDSFQLEAGLKYLDAGEVDATFGDYNPTYVIVGANYILNDEFAIYADLESEADSDRYSIGLKYDF